ncbi:MAG: ATP-binding protein, partial [Gammaproteobacteria bacterium]|nr:ATP-binding protein [Gammaproteobacteria bacterium]
LVGEGDQANEPDRDARLQTLRMAQALLQNQSNVMLVFDEMEDVFNPASIRFGRGGLQRGSKVYTNRILENNRVPTIWIINNPYFITIAHIRRMSLAIELNTPPASARKKVLSRILARHGCSLPEEEITELTRKEAIAPAVFDNAVKFAKSTSGNAEDVRFAVKSIVKAIDGGWEKPEVKRTVSDFQLTLANADTDLSVLADNVSRPDADRAFSLCLFGPPGTGKTEYVRYLASRMGMNVLVRRASDIFGPYIGQTEANIAGAFVEAKEEELFLVFDEADSFLADRKGAVRSWEVTQVNEMLTWMESHPLPFACTTNLMDHLDHASLRRFTLKMRFDFLTGEQAAGAFFHFFGVKAPAGLAAVPNLTPGDYVVVRKKAQVLGLADDPEKLVELLATEVGLRKSDLKVRGFRN